jgi:protein-S-isoprenylcysteine O-methyltransferase Ste14
LSICQFDTLIVILAPIHAFGACSQRKEVQVVAPGEQGLDSPIARPVVRPPLLFLVALILGFVLDHVLPLPIGFPPSGALYLAAGGGLVLAGITIFALGVRGFSRAATPVPHTRPTRTLVTTGVHGMSRNPIYVAMFLSYAGIGLAARSPWILLLTLPVMGTMHYGVVAREETYLERLFGDAYRNYKARVRRWL